MEGYLGCGPKRQRNSCHRERREAGRSTGARVPGRPGTSERAPLKLRPEQLPATLARGLGGVYLVSGDEPLLVGEAADAIRAAARSAGYLDRQVFFAERGFSWDELHN